MSDYEIALLLRAAATFMQIIARGDGPSVFEAESARSISDELLRAALQRQFGAA